MPHLLTNAAQGLLTLELPLLTLITFALWFPSPARDAWVWLLVLLLPIYAARYLLYRRLWTWTPLTAWLLAFIALLFVNVALGLWLAAAGTPSAPYSRGWLILGRPLLGLAIFVACVEHACAHGLHGLIARSVWLAFALGLFALGATQWPQKANQFVFITDHLPITRGFPGAENGFNPNEIAGALAWLTPLAAGIALYRWREKLPQRDVATLALAFCGAALFLGQSRAALIGALLALALLTLFLLKKRWRWLALTAVVAVALLQVLVVAQVFVPPQAAQTGGVEAQASQSLAPRFSLWSSALAMIRDFPLTGVGFTYFRFEPVRSLYPVEGVRPGAAVHAHNEWLQMGADFGLPGMLLYLVWHIVALRMIWRVWRQGSAEARALVMAVACGLLAHSVFGLLDAIPLADRFAFLFWWMLGLLGALYAVTAATSPPRQVPS
ncbi:MAG: O-antigen ligase family protein [Chloroflexi bacterium]|nr:O-antigen ligase family protein [Chloroflexota bacterium]